VYTSTVSFNYAILGLNSHTYNVTCIRTHWNLTNQSLVWWCLQWYSSTPRSVIISAGTINRQID